MDVIEASTTNVAGIILIISAVLFFVIEAHTGSGILLAAGIVALIVGLIILFTGPITRIGPALIATVILVVAFFIFAAWRIIQIHRRRATTGHEGLVSQTAVVKQALNPRGTVFLQGEHWSAESESGPIEAGQEVTITRAEGLKLYVTKSSQNNSK